MLVLSEKIFTRYLLSIMLLKLSGFRMVWMVGYGIQYYKKRYPMKCYYDKSYKIYDKILIVYCFNHWSIPVWNYIAKDVPLYQ